MANQNGIKMLEVKDVHAVVDGKEILQGFNLSVKSGEIHGLWVLMDLERVHLPTCLLDMNRMK